MWMEAGDPRSTVDHTGAACGPWGEAGFLFHAE